MGSGAEISPLTAATGRPLAVLPGRSGIGDGQGDPPGRPYKGFYI
jgi:hypothetical protein